MHIITIGKTVLTLGCIALEETRSALTLRRDVRRVRTDVLLDRARRAVERADLALREARADVVRMRETLDGVARARDEAMAAARSEAARADDAEERIGRIESAIDQRLPFDIACDDEGDALVPVSAIEAAGAEIRRRRDEVASVHAAAAQSQSAAEATIMELRREVERIVRERDEARAALKAWEDEEAADLAAANRRCDELADEGAARRRSHAEAVADAQRETARAVRAEQERDVLAKEIAGLRGAQGAVEP